jgi:WD repeat-containing protein 48
LVAHDNARIWTATSSSSVYQWPDIPTRANRSTELSEAIVPANLLKMNLNESTFTDHMPEHYYPTSTVYSAASLGSLLVTGVGSRDKQSQHSSEDDEGLITPIFDQPENVILGEHGLIKHTVLNNRRMVVTEDKCGEVALWDLIKARRLF